MVHLNGHLDLRWLILDIFHWLTHIHLQIQLVAILHGQTHFQQQRVAILFGLAHLFIPFHLFVLQIFPTFPRFSWFVFERISLFTFLFPLLSLLALYSMLSTYKLLLKHNRTETTKCRQQQTGWRQWSCRWFRYKTTRNRALSPALTRIIRSASSWWCKAFRS
jgi:hypothetical protein